VIRENVSLAEYTTFKIGGPARYFAETTNEEELASALLLAEANSLPVLVIGSGSNLLIADEGFPGLVIKVAMLGIEYHSLEDGSVRLVCGAGETLDVVIDDCVKRGYWGLENLSAIPGTIGATPVQNVGAYGVEINDVVESVETINLVTKEKKVFSNYECKFSYRDSIFKSFEGKNFLITKVFFKLNQNPNPKITYADLAKRLDGQIVTLKNIRDTVISVRAGKFPDWKIIGTAGSFFKNPIIKKAQAQALLSKYPDLPVYAVDDNNLKIPLGFVLDKICHLKGYRVGKVGLYTEQALVLVNYEDATADEVKKFAREISRIVEEKTGIKIEAEVRFIF